LFMMTQTKSKVTDSITLQDLFQLKRAETPPAGFWEQFEDSFHKKSLQAVAESSCQQRRSLLHGWGLGVCMASLLSLGLPIFLFLQSGSSYTSNTLLVNQQVNEVTERAHVVAEVTEQQPWRHVQVVDSRFVI